jgi:hypothetical protein
VETRHGGHCAFLGRDPGEEIHWAEATMMRFFATAFAGSAAEPLLAAESEKISPEQIFSDSYNKSGCA